MPAGISLYDKPSAAVTEYGSPYAWLMLLCQTDLTTPEGSWLTFPMIKSNVPNDTTAKTDLVPEHGKTMHVLGARNTTWEITSLQQDFGSRQFYDDYRGLPFIFVKLENQVPIQGKYFYRIIPNAYVEPVYNRTTPGNELKYTLYANPSPLICVDLTGITANNPIILTCSSFQFPADSLMGLYQQ